MLAVGDPLRKGEDRVIPPSGLHLYPLPYARQEAEAIAQLFPGAHLFVGTGAREAEIKKLLSKSAILHFATHGILDPLDGMRSGLLLSTEPEDSDEDGVLQGWEIVAASLEARVAVLSACETGGGDERLGEGLVGLAWAFHAAGCPNVIASLWSVNDASTRELMVAFYRALGRGDALETALRDAMLEERGKPGYESPFYWAAFQLIGPGGPFER
jgi:CHAT domain-containing protein